jgi:DNA polymerase-3 subunit alpha
MSLKDMDLFVEDTLSIAERWQDNPQVITNTKKLADRCDLEINLGQILLPKFPLNKGETENSKLDLLTWQGLAWRYGRVDMDGAFKLSAKQAKGKLTDEVIKRAEYELDVIGRMKYEGYFLIVWDFVMWGKERGIVFGPGRGSAAGSIVSYALRITELDPLKYDLLFERFLNPDRISMPDIDIDIQDNRRDEVIKYVADKYGQNRVANIVTFGKMAARNAIRDVSRVLEVPYADADRLAKLVPPPIQGRHIPLSKSIHDAPDLKDEYQNNPTSKKVIDLAMQLEGTIRSHGVHAAGVVIAPDEIVNYVPLEMAQKGVVATQYSMFPIEDIGLLKMDFLGLSNLTIIKNALRIVRKVHKREIDITEVPLDNVKTYQLLSRGDTTGVFQLESSGMKRYLKELGPTEFDDIIAMVALYRPGPLAEIPRFIEGKNNPDKVEYLNKLLEPILKDTYGVMVYQEQIINLLQLIAGYSAGEADLVRKAIGKKKRDIMQAEEPKFIKGCLKQGLSKSDASKLWNLIQPFADYSFNKAHAACYGLIAYWTAYLKANYPEAFMASLMTSNYDNTEQLALDIAECKDMGIDVLKPDINQSFLEFGVVQDTMQIRFGLAAIKNVGVGAVEALLEVRDRGGKFMSIEDFTARVDSRVVNRKTLESLVKAGAFDEMESRDKLLYNLDTIVGYSAKLHKEKLSGQTDLFELNQETDMSPKLVLEEPPSATPDREQLQWERELLGVYLSDHPLEAFRVYLSDKTQLMANLSKKLDDNCTVGGMITTIREITTKNGQRMAFVGLEGLDGSTELIIFPKIYEKVRPLIEADRLVQATGKVSAKDREGRSTDEIKLLVDELVELGDKHRSHKPASNGASSPSLSSKEASSSSKLYVHVKDPNNHSQLMDLKQTLNRHPGSTEAILVLGDKQKNALRLPFRVDISNGLQAELASLMSKEAVVVK